MPMRVCVDCGTVFPAENFNAKRCCLCAAKHGVKPAAHKVYPKPAVDALTRDAREADAAGISYGKLQIKGCLPNKRNGKNWKQSWLEMSSGAKRKRGRVNEYREMQRMRAADHLDRHNEWKENAL